LHKNFVIHFLSSNSKNMFWSCYSIQMKFENNTY
jgi:hypothetical protein